MGTNEAIDRTEYTQRLRAAAPNLTDEELKELVLTAERKAKWNVAMRQGGALARTLCEQRRGRITHAIYDELWRFCQEIGVNGRLAAELWNVLAMAIANVSRANTGLARTTSLKVETLRGCSDGRVDLELRPPLRQLLGVWIASY